MAGWISSVVSENKPYNHQSNFSILFWKACCDIKCLCWKRPHHQSVLYDWLPCSRRQSSYVCYSTVSYLASLPRWIKWWVHMTIMISLEFKWLHHKHLFKDYRIKLTWEDLLRKCCVNCDIQYTWILFTCSYIYPLETEHSWKLFTILEVCS